ncbi:MAG: GTPase ObgE [Oscillospiraceae bacterium]|jgi:GTP-binding protein|nr:GTPase ObgE [Oscillospiraceae bacterium]
MFVDKVEISVAAGAGGNGCVSFHREKYVAAGGPDGGDGGDGGNIVLKADKNMSTLMDFRFRRKYSASGGADGGSRNMTGRDGAELVIKIPDGTVVRDKATGAVIKDMSGEDEFVLCRGGNGGWGNKRFATPTRQAPRFARPGLSGQKRDVILELKLIADAGLVGFPNVGKSTLLSVVSKARPKIADYHFTTLYPNLGIVYVGEGESFVLADIPGIIEGAADGAGLGHAFLRHIERTRLLIHVVDVSGSEGRDPKEDFDTITGELSAYGAELASRPVIVAGNKTDSATEGQIEEFRAFAEAKGLAFFPISAVTGEGVQPLLYEAARRLRELPPPVVFEPEYVDVKVASDVSTLEIRREGGVWLLEGEWLERVIRGINFGELESRQYFDRLLDRAGVNARLRELGIAGGDTVVAGNFEFEYVE